jgi:hypothetical protein
VPTYADATARQGNRKMYKPWWWNQPKAGKLVDVYNGQVAELAYALASGASESNLVEVQILSCPQT